MGLNHGLGDSIRSDIIFLLIFVAGNTVFLIPDLKIAYMADIVTPKRFVFVLTTTANVSSNIQALLNSLFLK